METDYQTLSVQLVQVVKRLKRSASGQACDRCNVYGFCASGCRGTSRNNQILNFRIKTKFLLYRLRTVPYL